MPFKACIAYNFDDHTLFILLKAIRALQNFNLMSCSVPPVVLTILPRRVNSDTSSIGLDLSVTLFAFAFFILIALVSLPLILTYLLTY